MTVEQKRAVKADPAAAAETRTEPKSTFFTELWTELKKTTWPSKEEANRLTGVVLGVIVAVAIYMGTLDFLLSFIVKKFSLIK